MVWKYPTVLNHPGWPAGSQCMVLCLAAFLLLPARDTSAQTALSGVVTGQRGDPVFAANVYPKSNPPKGVITDVDGRFSLAAVSRQDTLVVSFIGYQTKLIALADIDFSRPLTVMLAEDRQALAEVVVSARDPVSEQFSVAKMSMLKDVYLSPVAQGDPLKAITALPASTTADETASPSLRGSAPDRTRVVLNGVPVYNPVRANQLNNQGFFSLFNPEMIDKMYVYAGNPPLTYGNTSAGLVEIRTHDNLDANRVQLAAGLAGAGAFLSQQLKNSTSFIQVYGNYQFSDAFVGIQEKYLPDISNFNTRDAGLNLRWKMGKRIEFNTYNYFITERFNGYSGQLTYRGELATASRRFFTINNIKLFFDKGTLSINGGADNSRSSFRFGNIYSGQRAGRLYASLDYHWFMAENFDLQLGVSYDWQRNDFNDSIPEYYYALTPRAPNHYRETTLRLTMPEACLYANWRINDKFTLSSGWRSNIPAGNRPHYLSGQLGLKYRHNKIHSFLLGAGRYHSYTVPGYYQKRYRLLAASQVSLDYTFRMRNTVIAAAAYYKKETGAQPVAEFFTADEINTLGLELYLEHSFFNYFRFSLSNACLDQKMILYGTEVPGPSDFGYFLRASVRYSNPGLFTLAFTYAGRPGTYYNEVTGAAYDSRTGFYEPQFSEVLFGRQYAAYHRLDLSLSRYFRVKDNALIIFASLNNILNTHNESGILYSPDYVSYRFEYFQFRTLYFGAVWQLSY